MTLRDLTWAALMTALCFVATMFHFVIPLNVGNTMIHFGNVFMLVGGMLLGSWLGGASAGIGMAASDLFGGVFAFYAPGTLIGKFLAGFVCGKIAHKNARRPTAFRHCLVAAVCGILVNIVCSSLNAFCVQKFIYGVELTPALLGAFGNFGASLINGSIAVILSLAIYLPLQKALGAMGLAK